MTPIVNFQTFTEVGVFFENFPTKYLQTLYNQHHLVDHPEEISETERGLFPKKK